MISVHTKAVAVCPCGTEAKLELRQTIRIDHELIERSGVVPSDEAEAVVIPILAGHHTTPVVVWPRSWLEPHAWGNGVRVRCPECRLDVSESRTHIVVGEEPRHTEPEPETRPTSWARLSNEDGE